MDISFIACEAGWSRRAPSCSSGPLFLFVILIETADLASSLLPTSHQLLSTPHSDIALARWLQGHDGTLPAGADAVKEKNWDNINTVNTASTRLESARNEVEHARLLAAMDRGSGAWLQALTISSMGLRMDDSTVRTAVGLHLGTTIYAPHTCQRCGEEVLALGTHGLSCKLARVATFDMQQLMTSIAYRVMDSVGQSQMV